MNKYKHLINSKISALSVVFLCAFQSTLFAVEGTGIIAGPYLQHVTQTSMVIMWETNVAATSTVKFGKARFVPAPGRNKPEPKAPLDRVVSLDKMINIHEVRLENLEAQTDYFYQVLSVSKDGKILESDVFIFQTAVREDSPFAYVVMGDNRTYPDRFKKLTDMAYAERPNFVINVGDVVSDGKVKEQWITEYLAPAAELMHRVPTYVSIGNHERDAKWYYRYVSYPGNENYYSFDYGNAHFTIVDSNKDLSPGSKEYEWIKADLASSKAKWKFVAHHHPPYSSDSDDYGNTAYSLSTRMAPEVKSLIPLYEQHGVDIVWCGHIHDYERTWPIRGGKVDEKNGVIYIQAGGGGAGLENFAPTRSWFTAKLLRYWQYCLVTIHDGTFRMMAYDIDGKMYDFLELKK